MVATAQFLLQNPMGGRN